jgi:hypothetical protein
LANVRSAIGATIALALLALGPLTAGAKALPEADLLLLPPQTTVGDLARVGLSPGLMSAGLGAVPANQTYLDIGQGNRVFDSLYDEDLPPIDKECWIWQKEAQVRAESAPAEIDPFLLFSMLGENGIGRFWRGRTACPFGGYPGGNGAVNRGALFTEEVSLRALVRARKQLATGDLLVAIAKPIGESDEPVAIGISGRGIDGNLTSGSTRMDGYVLSTDVAPTIFNYFGIDVPSAMSGQPIRGEGSVDAAAIESLGARMAVISSRRGPVIGLNIVIWLAVLALVALLSRGRLACPAVRMTALAIVYLPLVLLLGADLEPGETGERLLVFLLCPLLAIATSIPLRGYRALALASALTVIAYAVDVIAGSPLTSLSLLGPNPGLGVRFYGIGNELEALLAVLVVAGTGAGLAGFAPRAASRPAAIAFVVTGLLAALVFSAGRFGADVGAAIVFPVGAVVAAMAVAGRGRRPVLLAVVAAPVAVLALLALVDLLSGANAHLTRSVLDAGGFGDLADVAQRRLQLSVRSFARPVLAAFLPVVLAAAGLAYLKRGRLQSWLEGSPALRAGLLGGLAATVVGTLANDSGALVLEIGTAYLLVFTGFAWTESAAKCGKAEK